jgi:hypothetical protein
MFGSDQPDDARDECVRLLIERGARGYYYESKSPVISRIFREALALARVPQLLNEAVLGVAFAQQHESQSQQLGPQNDAA